LRFVSEEQRHRDLVREHCDWIAAHGSLHAAVAASERDFDAAPILRWYRAHSAKLAAARGKSQRQYRNTKKTPVRTDPMGDVARPRRGNS
jgi:hypothetical protein